MRGAGSEYGDTEPRYSVPSEASRMIDPSSPSDLIETVGESATPAVALAVTGVPSHEHDAHVPPQPSLSVLSVEAIKEQQAQIEDLKSEVAELKSMLEEMKSMLLSSKD